MFPKSGWWRVREKVKSNLSQFSQDAKNETEKYIHQTSQVEDKEEIQASKGGANENTSG